MKKLKEEKGSITLFVLISMLFFVLILAGMYMLNMAKEESGISQTSKIKEIYEKDVNQIDNVYETLTNVQKVNAPVYKNSGLIPVTIAADGTLNIADTTNNDWYSYDGKENQWANARTVDGSMFVWIPRFAYKITYTDASDKSKGGTIDVVFLKGKTNFDFNGNNVTSSSYVDENGVTGAYIVHPAFKNGTSNSYANGEWNKEVEGFWMAKFEAGYQDADKAVDSEVGYNTIYSWNGNTMVDIDTNYYGTREVGTLIKYPIFQANKASMNYIGISDAYDLCQNMTSPKAPYKLTSIVKPHLTKNSEWGAVAYLTHSKYGRNGNEVTINNINLEGANTVYGVTGYAGESIGADAVITTLVQIQNGTQAGSWTTSQGQKASTTGNIYGIYDLSGGNWEWIAGYIINGTYTKYSGSLKGESNQYESKYANGSDTISYNTEPNPTRVGEAIWETSTSGAVDTYTSWNNDDSFFPTTSWPFFVRGGAYYKTTEAGLFNFFYNTGCCHFSIGFRPVLIVD